MAASPDAAPYVQPAMVWDARRFELSSQPLYADVQPSGQKRRRAAGETATSKGSMDPSSVS